eukprot:scaffold682315_cov29-Prasinocladus_malaysianus.AAC.1
MPIAQICKKDGIVQHITSKEQPRAAGDVLTSTFESSFRADVRKGLRMIHLIRLLRQRHGDANAQDLLGKALGDAAEFPMQVLFGKWQEHLAGRWPCKLWRRQTAGFLYVSTNFV